MLEVPRMRIPVFVSCPSPENLSPEQDRSATIVFELVARYKLQWRALGRSDYPLDLPLREVSRMVKHCSGAIILGFEQFFAPAGTYRRDGVKAADVRGVSMPTPWNHLEGGIAYASGLPLLIFREAGIAGGIFDIGTTEIFVHEMPSDKMSAAARDDFDSVFQNWVARVRTHYYGQ